MSDQGRRAIRRWLLMVDQGCLAIRPLWKLKLSRRCKIWALGLGLHQATEEFCSLIKPLRGFAFLKLSQRFQVWSSVKVLVTQSCPIRCNPIDCTCQAPLAMEFSRQEYWSGYPFLSPGDLTYPGVEPASPALQMDSLPSESPGKWPFVRFTEWPLSVLKLIFKYWKRHRQHQTCGCFMK